MTNDLGWGEEDQVGVISEEMKASLSKVFPGWKPAEVEQEEEAKGFDEPIKGSYDVEIKNFTAKSGKEIEAVEYKKVATKDGEKEIIKLKFKIVKEHKGDKSMMRLMDRTFWMGKNSYAEDPEDETAGVKNLISALTSIGATFSVDNALNYEQFAKDLQRDLNGFRFRIAAYVNSKGKQALKCYALKVEEEGGTNPFV